MTDIVINACFGGFNLSREALTAYAERRGLDERDVYSGDLRRDDVILVDVVRDLGPKASGQSASLRIVEVPDDVDWEISEYDGYEHVAESHRTWH